VTFLAIGMGVLLLCVVGIIVTISMRLTVFDLKAECDPLWQQDDDR